jgi:hypothetical protein
MIRRRLIALIGLLVVIFSLSGVITLPASAAVSPAAGDIICSGNLCIQTDSTTSSTAKISAWADHTTFKGHFEMQIIGGQVENSPTKTWTAGGAGYQFSMPCSTSYTYQATAWKKVSDGWEDIGEVVFYIDSC